MNTKPTMVQTLWTDPIRAHRDSIGSLFDPATRITTAWNSMFCWRNGIKRVLYTDDAGYDFFKNKILEKLYDEIRPIPLDPMFLDLKPEVMWSFAKLLSMNHALSISEHVVHVDFDAKIGSQFWEIQEGSFIAMNPEPIEWDCYKNNHTEFSAFITSYLNQIGIDTWNATRPVNTGVFYCKAKDLFNLYFCKVREFIDWWTLTGKKPIPMTDYSSASSSGTKFFQEVVFYEQHVLALLASHYNWPLTVLTQFNAVDQFPDYTKKALHLWTAKSRINRNDVLRHKFKTQALQAMISLTAQLPDEIAHFTGLKATSKFDQVLGEVVTTFN